MHKVAAVIPTRGLIFAKTIQGLIGNGRDILGGLFLMVDDTGNGYPMPACFNKGVNAALMTDCTHILFVEEDNEVVDGVIEAMLALEKPVVTLDYPMGRGQSHINRDKDGQIISCGLGCTLFERAVFEAIQYPWFEVDKVVDAKTREVTPLPAHQVPKKYGGHDVLFGMKLKEAGFDIAVLPDWRGRHFRAKELPKREMNNGCYTIYSL